MLYVEALSPAGRSFGQTYGLRLTPAFALFDREGRLIRIWMGAEGMPTRSELEAILREGG